MFYNEVIDYDSIEIYCDDDKNMQQAHQYLLGESEIILDKYAEIELPYDKNNKSSYEIVDEFEWSLLGLRDSDFKNNAEENYVVYHENTHSKMIRIPLDFKEVCKINDMEEFVHILNSRIKKVNEKVSYIQHSGYSLRFYTINFYRELVQLHYAERC